MSARKLVTSPTAGRSSIHAHNIRDSAAESAAPGLQRSFSYHTIGQPSRLLSKQVTFKGEQPDTLLRLKSAEADSLRQQLDMVNTDFQANLKLLEKRDRELGKLDAAVSDLKSGLIEQQLSRQHSRKEVEEYAVLATASQDEAHTLRRQLQDSQHQLLVLQQQLLHSKGQGQEAQQQADSASKQLANVQTELQAALMRNQHSNQLHEQQLQQLRLQLELEAVSKCSTLEVSIREQEAAKAVLEQQQIQHNSQVQELKQQLECSHQQALHQADKLKTTQAALAELQAMYRQLENDSSSSTAQVRMVADSAAAKSAETIEDLERRLASAEQAARSHQQQVRDNSSCADQRYQEYERNIDALIANVHQLRQQCEQQSSELAQCAARQQQAEDENSRLRRSLKQHEEVVAVHRSDNLMLETALAEEVAAHAATTVDLSMTKQELLKGAAADGDCWGIAAGSPTMQASFTGRITPSPTSSPRLYAALSSPRAYTATMDACGVPSLPPAFSMGPGPMKASPRAAPAVATAHHSYRVDANAISAASCRPPAQATGASYDVNLVGTFSSTPDRPCSSLQAASFHSAPSSRADQLSDENARLRCQLAAANQDYLSRPLFTSLAQPPAHSYSCQSSPSAALRTCQPHSISGTLNISPSPSPRDKSTRTPAPTWAGPAHSSNQQFQADPVWRFSAVGSNLHRFESPGELECSYDRPCCCHRNPARKLTFRRCEACGGLPAPQDTSSKRAFSKSPKSSRSSKGRSTKWTP